MGLLKALDAKLKNKLSWVQYRQFYSEVEAQRGLLQKKDDRTYAEWLNENKLSILTYGLIVAAITLASIFSLGIAAVVSIAAVGAVLILNDTTQSLALRT